MPRVKPSLMPNAQSRTTFIGTITHSRNTTTDFIRAMFCVRLLTIFRLEAFWGHWFSSCYGIGLSDRAIVMILISLVGCTICSK
jgi:hypothetical protein